MLLEPLDVNVKLQKLFKETEWSSEAELCKTKNFIDSIVIEILNLASRD